MAVAPQGRPQLGGGAFEDRLAVAFHAFLGFLLEVLQVGRGPAGQGLDDDLLGGLADARQVTQAAGGGPLFRLPRRAAPAAIRAAVRKARTR